MLTLDEHNEQKQAIRERLRIRKAGVLCPVCKVEMIMSDPHTVLTDPPKVSVKCPDCGHHGYKLT